MFVTFAILSAVGIVTNLACFIRTMKTLRFIQKSLFALVLMDSTSSLVCCAAFFGMCVILSSGYVSELNCSLLFVSLHTPSLVGIVTTAEIAAVRYIALTRSAHNRRVHDNYFLAGVIVTMVVLVALVLANTWIHWHFELPLAIVSETCLYGQSGGRPFLTISKLGAIVPLIVFLVIAVAFDCLILRFIHKNVSPNVANLRSLADQSHDFTSTVPFRRSATHNQSTYDAIPARATLWSAFTIVPYLAIGATVSLHATVLGPKAATIIGVIALTLNAARSPVTIMVTFVRNERVLKEERERGTRERRQQSIREAARKKRLREKRVELKTLNAQLTNVPDVSMQPVHQTRF